MNNIPEKHRAVAHAWVDGAEIETLENDGAWRVIRGPSFYNECDYRVKPKIVKKYRWLLMRPESDLMYVKGTFDEFVVTAGWFSEQEVHEMWPSNGNEKYVVIQKVEGTEKIVQE